MFTTVVFRIVKKLKTSEFHTLVCELSKPWYPQKGMPFNYSALRLRLSFSC